MKIGRYVIPVLFIVAIVLIEVCVYFSNKIIIVTDGKKKVVYTKLKTVNDILFKARVKIDDNDIVDPPLHSALGYPRIIKLIRVDEKIEEKVESLKPQLIKRERSDTNLRPVVYKKVKLGKVTTKFKVTYHDGKEVKREIIEKKKDTRVEEFLHLLDIKGKHTIKVYNLTKSPKKKMIATAYYPGDPLAWRDGTITFLGLKMQRGIVAVDPNVIPLRTRLYIPGFGYGYAADTGSAIKGDRIDLGVNNAEEEKPWMHRPVVVYILGPSKKW